MPGETKANNPPKDKPNDSASSTNNTGSPSVDDSQWTNLICPADSEADGDAEPINDSPLVGSNWLSGNLDLEMEKSTEKGQFTKNENGPVIKLEGPDDDEGLGATNGGSKDSIIAPRPKIKTEIKEEPLDCHEKNESPFCFAKDVESVPKAVNIKPLVEIKKEQEETVTIKTEPENDVEFNELSPDEDSEYGEDYDISRMLGLVSRFFHFRS